MSIAGLDPSSPASTAPAGLGDDELRNLKVALQNVLIGLDSLVTAGTGNPAATTADFIKLFDDVASLTGGVGSGFVNEIRMWYGNAEDVPSGWFICDGSNGTPDLRDRFMYGADSTTGLPLNGGQSFGGTVGSGSTGLAGGETLSVNIPDHTLTIANIPEHNHSLFGSEANTSAGGTPVQSGQAASADVSNTADNNKPYQISPVPTNPSGTEPTVGRSSNTGQASPSPLTHGSSQVITSDHTHDLTGALPPWAAVYFIQYKGT